MIIQSPTIIRTLDVSTAHITFDENVLLERAAGYSGALRDGPISVPVTCVEGGFSISVPDRDEVVIAAGHFAVMGAPNVAKLLQAAAEHECWYIRLTNDGDSYHDLPAFDW